MTRSIRSGFLVGGALIFLASTTAGQMIIEEINPTKSTLYPTQSNASGGGRVTKLGSAGGLVFYAATEWGGLYKTVDGGLTWTRLDAHLPTAMWDVKVSPLTPSFLIATSFYDGRVNSRAGINVSMDAGLTWSHPASAVPPVGLCPPIAQTQPSAYGIAYDRDFERAVYVGTSCGLAISRDLGNTWRYVDPTPATLAGNVWSVVVHHGSIVDLCGSDGHRRSIDQGITWQTAAPGKTPLPAGQCTITASPDESYVLFASLGQQIFESDDGGVSWNAPFTSPDPAGTPRFPFVATNKPRPGSTFDLWFGDTSLYRATCTTPAKPAPGGKARCPNPAATTWAGAFTTTAGGHDDMADIVFSPPGAVPPASCATSCNSDRGACEEDCKDERDLCKAKVGKTGGTLASECATRFTSCKAACQPKATACLAKCKPTEACPLLMASDGGIYRNTRRTGPSCQSPSWTQPLVTPRALWLFGMVGSNRPRNREEEDLYFVNQDNGTFATRNAGAAVPSWVNADVGDGFDVAASSSSVVSTQCCNLPLRSPQLYRGGPGMSGDVLVPNAPPGIIRGFQFPDPIARFSANGYAVATSNGIFTTGDVTASPVAWTQLGTGLPAAACAIQVSGTATNPVFLAQVGSCTGSSTDAVFTHSGTGAGGPWQQVNAPAAFGPFVGFGLLTVDPVSPARMFASVVSAVGFQTARSVDGGTTWTADAALDARLTAGGAIQAMPTLGPRPFFNFGTYAQPTLLAYDPQDPKTLLAGGADAGIFISRDTGSTWTTVTDNSGLPGKPVIPRPWFAYFNRECGESNIYVGTQGRGVWRLRTDEGRATAQEPCFRDCIFRSEPCQGQCDVDHDECKKDAAGSVPAGQLCEAALQRCRSKCQTDVRQCREGCDVCPTSP